MNAAHAMLSHVSDCFQLFAFSRPPDRRLLVNVMVLESKDIVKRAEKPNDFNIPCFLAGKSKKLNDFNGGKND
jgi:hypothetical protein